VYRTCFFCRRILSLNPNCLDVQTSDGHATWIVGKERRKRRGPGKMCIYIYIYISGPYHEAVVYVYCVRGKRKTVSYFSTDTSRRPYLCGREKRPPIQKRVGKTALTFRKSPTAAISFLRTFSSRLSRESSPDYKQSKRPSFFRENPKFVPANTALGPNERPTIYGRGF